MVTMVRCDASTQIPDLAKVLQDGLSSSGVLRVRTTGGLTLTLERGVVFYTAKVWDGSSDEWPGYVSGHGLAWHSWMRRSNALQRLRAVLDLWEAAGSAVQYVSVDR